MWVDIEQGTEEWHELRTGKVTGSVISKVMANYGKAFGEPAKRLAVDIAVFNKTGLIEHNDFTNEHMKRGIEQEPIARQLYEQQYFYDVTNGGFYDNGETGCSPDGIVEKGIIEIKSVIPSKHFETIKRGNIDSACKWQIAFNLLESKKDWIDFISYCEVYPKDKQLFVFRKTRKDFKEEFKQIKERLNLFFRLVDEYQGTLNEK